MAKKKIHKSDTNIEGVENVLSRTEQFIEDNQKSIMIVVGIIIAFIAIVLLYRKFYLVPIELEAQSQMFVAEQYFEKDSFNLALYGDGNYLGFIDIIDEYGLTKSVNLARYYSGISLLKTGEYNEAINYLKKFKTKDKIVSAISFGAIGDAYVELEELDKAADYYKKAANHNDNIFSAPIYLMKLAQVHEKLDNYQKAIDTYEIIKDKYSKTTEGRKVDMYIARAKFMLEE